MSVIWLINKRATNNLFTHILEFKKWNNQNISIHSIQNLKKSIKIMKDYTLPTSTLLKQKNNVEIIDVWKNNLYILSFQILSTL